jgi:hypothetical protein
MSYGDAFTVAREGYLETCKVSDVLGRLFVPRAKGGDRKWEEGQAKTMAGIAGFGAFPFGCFGEGKRRVFSCLLQHSLLEGGGDRDVEGSWPTLGAVSFLQGDVA